MAYKLIKPYTAKQYADFIVLHNHQNGRKIEEGVNGELFALEPYEKLVDGEVIDNTQEYEQEQERQEAEHIALLNLTAADVERAIYKAKGMDFEDVIEMVSKLVDTSPLPSPQGEGEKTSIDLKALKIELKANNFYRGNPYINVVGTLLGFTSEQLDEFFETNDYTKLLTNEGVDDEDTTDTDEFSDEVGPEDGGAEENNPDSSGEPEETDDTPDTGVETPDPV